MTAITYRPTMGAHLGIFGTLAWCAPKQEQVTDNASSGSPSLV